MKMGVVISAYITLCNLVNTNSQKVLLIENYYSFCNINSLWSSCVSDILFELLTPRVLEMGVVIFSNIAPMHVI